MPLTTVGIDAPDDFPTERYEAAYEAARNRISRTPAWNHFRGGWSGLAYRFISCSGHDARFVSSLAQHGPAPDHAERYNQEHELFGFFVSGFSAVETFAFAAHALACGVAPDAFPMQRTSELRAVGIASLSNRLTTHYPEAELTQSLTALRADAIFREWGEIRNVLSHRITPQRRLRLVNEGVDEAAWHDIPIGIETTRRRREWLVLRLASLMTALQGFI
jgi:hypothetical protein